MSQDTLNRPASTPQVPAPARAVANASTDTANRAANRAANHPATNAAAAQPAATDRHHEAAMLPPVDVIEDAGGILLLADLPGVPKDRVQVRVESDTLTIEGEVQMPLPQDMDASHVELQTPRYRRSFTLSKELDTTQVVAESRDGVLQVRIPKAAHAQPRRIEVQVG